MAIVTVVHEDGRTARMTESRFAAVASNGWQLYDPASVVDPPNQKAVRKILDEVGDDPVKASAALALEQDGKNRPTLTKKLTAIVDAGGTTQEA